MHVWRTCAHAGRDDFVATNHEERPLGDTAIALDPIVAQGANAGNRMARHLVGAITARGDRPFDEAWITETFERHWNDFARHAVAFTNMFLEPPTLMMAAYLFAQYGSDGRADRKGSAQAPADVLTDNLAEPARILQDEAKIRSFIHDKTGSFLGSVARAVPHLLRAQIRQRLGRDPGHPLASDATTV